MYFLNALLAGETNKTFRASSVAGADLPAGPALVCGRRAHKRRIYPAHLPGALSTALSTVLGTTAKPCPRGLSGVTDAGNPDLILTEAITSGEARVGRIVQARPAANYRWAMAQPVPALATPINGDYGEHIGVCFWTFRAVAAGSATATFNGANLCEPQPARPGAVARRCVLQVLHREDRLIVASRRGVSLQLY
jgi:hypothetical protein